MAEEAERANAKVVLADMTDVRIETVLREWAHGVAKLPSLEREVARSKKVEVLSGLGFHSPARLVDSALAEYLGKKGVEARRSSQAPMLIDPDPWFEPVDGAELLTEIEYTLLRYLVLPAGASLAVSLWALFTYCYEAFQVSPRLALSSPEKRCGKTRTLEVLGALVRRPLPASNITAAVVFRAIEKCRPTLLIDEADTFLRDNDELRGILNSGHTRSTAFVVRAVAAGDDFEPRLFCTWGPVAVAMIGKLPATLEDRAVVVPMRRRAPHEKVEALRLDRMAALEPLRRKAARWAADNMDLLAAAEPSVPELGSDRAVDNWRPLLAIADAAGGSWPRHARAAACLLCPGDPVDDGAGVQLLADLRELFEHEHGDRLTSEFIVRSLSAMEERPWPEWHDAKHITPRQVARLLKPFGIAPQKLRLSAEETGRGYHREHFEDAFARYLPSKSGTRGTCLQKGAFSCGTEMADVPHENAEICRDVPGVPDERGVLGEEAVS